MKETTTEQHIIEAAKKVFIAKGYENATMRDIAKEANVNSAMVHYYFRSKDKLFGIVFDSIGKFFYENVYQIYKEDLDIFEKIRKVVYNRITILIQHPELPSFLVREMFKRPELLEHNYSRQIKESCDVFMLQVEAAMANGRIRKINPMNLFLNIDSLCVFPFHIRPLMQHCSEISEAEFNELMNERCTDVADFIIQSIKL